MTTTIEHSRSGLGALAHDLNRCVPGGVRCNVPLSLITQWRAGGPAALLVEPRTTDEVAAVMRFARARPDLPFFIMGDSSNVLFDDRGFAGIVLRIGRRLAELRITATTAWAQAGIWVPTFARRVGGAGLAGVQHTIGIPGTLGGLIVMNGGSQRKGIGLNVNWVKCIDEDGEPFQLDRAACGFGYRSSVLQRLRAVVVEAEFFFECADPQALRREMIEIMASRQRRFPKNLPNCGSVFVSDPKMYDVVGPPGEAIEAAGLKGLRRGNAQVSPMHANFIVNLGRARAGDILWLIDEVRSRVHAQTGFWMDCEVRHVAPDGTVRMAHLAAAEHRASMAPAATSGAVG